MIYRVVECTLTSDHISLKMPFFAIGCFFLCLLILGEYGLIDLGFNNILDNVNYQVNTERK
jgi:uncharacterized membrane protein (Fun14 family)